MDNKYRKIIIIFVQNIVKIVCFIITNAYAMDLYQAIIVMNYFQIVKINLI